MAHSFFIFNFQCPKGADFPYLLTFYLFPEVFGARKVALKHFGNL
jgi:hypothetical protein